MKLLKKFAVHCVLITTSLLLVTGCQKTEVRYSDTLDKNALMALPFPGWAPSGTARVQTVDMSALASKAKTADAASTRAEVTPLYVVKLDDTHAALVTQALPVGASDVPDDCHACSGAMGAYFFEHSGSGWRLTSKQDSVAESGVESNIGKTGVAKLGDGQFAVTAEWGSCWQGNCGTWLVVVGLQREHATLLNPGVTLAQDNDGARGACSALDAPPSADSNAEPASECVEIEGQWKFQGNRLLVSYQGRLSQPDTKGQLQPTQKIAQQVVYEATPGKLTLVSGSNPVPGF
ncbi:hypothetical protein [Rhodoferax saidenbachensis]|uniref:Lipoprotein n=1 Tax=Rhodoferax saidenbachensis TaxID=1484693 RepID=A0ABU1ZSZ6_9BURK|nr:hypothetical protein [Rhodoferax saidenbachensis]MDR7307651.1 hypothetical protein [Rhodoferax saidenbachensis]